MQKSHLKSKFLDESQLAHGNGTPEIPLKRVAVDAVIANIFADVTHSYFYENISAELQESSFVFPLPSDGSVYGFEVQVGDLTFISSCRERGEVSITLTLPVLSHRLMEFSKKQMKLREQHLSLMLTRKWVTPSQCELVTSHRKAELL